MLKENKTIRPVVVAYWSSLSADFRRSRAWATSCADVSVEAPSLVPVQKQQKRYDVQRYTYAAIGQGNDAAMFSEYRNIPERRTACSRLTPNT